MGKKVATRRGAPEKPPGDRKSVLLGVRMTTAEREEVNAAAEGKASTWAREVLLRAARRRNR